MTRPSATELTEAREVATTSGCVASGRRYDTVITHLVVYRHVDLRKENPVEIASFPACVAAKDPR